MKHHLSMVALALLLVALLSPCGYGQGASSALIGTVFDSSGAVVPGAEVVVKEDATGAEFKTITVENGTFSIPSLHAGTYTATISMASFKQSIIKNIVLNVGTPTNIRVKLEVGGSNETVTVLGGAEIVQSSSASISATMSTRQISQLPLETRNVMDFLLFLPGASTTTTARAMDINGLPVSTINITWDGIPTQNQDSRTGMWGAYSMITPRQDAVQEVTVSTAAAGADSTGSGAVQIRFVTRSGNNEFHGSLYDYERNTAFNSNYWFNNRDAAPVYTGDGPGYHQKCTAQQLATDFDHCKAPNNQAVLHQAGGRISGPITIPHLFSGKDKAFWFLNLEAFRQPNSRTLTRTIYSPAMQQGIFSYVAGGTVKTVDLMALAQANGQTYTLDPTVQKLISDIRNATTTTGAILSYPTVSDPNYQQFIWQPKGMETRNAMTTRFDFNLTNKQRLEISWNGETRARLPDFPNGRGPAFPGFPIHGDTPFHEGSISTTLRSTISPRLVNEVRGGHFFGNISFYPNASVQMWEGGTTGIANLGGFSWTPSGITNPTGGLSQMSRTNAPVTTFEDTLSWAKGSHSLSFGGSFTRYGSWAWSQTPVPALSLGLNSTYDPAYIMFNSANGPKNFPNATATQYGNAGTLYASLTGRITAITGSAVINENTNQYTYLGPQTERGRQFETGIFAQDSWRIYPNFTFTYGLRWQLQLPWTPLNNAFSWTSPAEVWGPSGVGNIFKPGATGGVPSLAHEFLPGTRAYNTDWKSFAPSVGFAWTPTATGLLGKFLGNSKTVIRSGFAIAYNRVGMSQYQDNLFINNPGGTINADRSTTKGNLLNAGQTWPLLLTPNLKSGLGAPSFPSSPTWPITPSVSDSLNSIDQNIRTPYTMSWTFGIQREITKNMVLEVRYAGSRNLQPSGLFNLNEYNLVENGFL